MQPVPIVLNSQTVSGIAGSVSIACWIIVFVPQIYENFYRKSAEGLSLMFVVLWLAGDIFNLLGAMLQHLLPTMIILAAYYTIADIILLVQCLFYGQDGPVDPVHLSPANPINENVLQDVFHEHDPLLGDERHRERHDYVDTSSSVSVITSTVGNKNSDSTFKRYLLKIMIVSSVILAGFLSWYISYIRNPPKQHEPELDLQMNWLAQSFGYLSAVLYLGSRVPQILLNFKRKSCEGISFLFFLFACLGNTTFIISVLSISFSPRYLLVNSSWLIGSSGTLIMDFIIFIQFFVYNGNSKNSQEFITV
ncbi:Cationic amino acid transporter [Kluyveromyces marxianus]|nr:Cationic amino acid transporter [Kluyveromyces marxianus]KAG0682627.1 Cationic amino acid transporter [Kluyveromyces marxianus]